MDLSVGSARLSVCSLFAMFFLSCFSTIRSDTGAFPAYIRERFNGAASQRNNRESTRTLKKRMADAPKRGGRAGPKTMFGARRLGVGEKKGDARAQTLGITAENGSLQRDSGPSRTGVCCV